VQTVWAPPAAGLLVADVGELPADRRVLDQQVPAIAAAAARLITRTVIQFTAWAYSLTRIGRQERPAMSPATATKKTK
jgi:hypothetical protein